jgi:hypothetical protein
MDGVLMNNSKKKFRHELKYFINYQDYLIIKSKISAFLKLDPYANENREYFIRSLYFDDVYDSALFEKNFGVYKRKKYRIRIYNYNDKTIKLERKSKVGQYTLKESEKITRGEYEALMHNYYDTLIGSSSEVKKDFFLNIRNKILRPKVIVDYEREAYISPISDVRITFDKHLRVAYNSNYIFDKSLSTKCLVPMPRLILEIKYNEFLPDYLRPLLVHNGDLSAISKYVFCRTFKGNI